MNEIALSKSQMSGNDIQQVISMIDRESANSIYLRCAEEFGFKIVEVEHTIFSTAAELAIVFGYGYPRNAMNVLAKNSISTRTISGLLQSEASLIRQAFGLAASDFSTRLIDYHGFLTIAIEGHGTACDKVREYLLSMEQKARVDTVIYDNTGFITGDFQDVGKYADDPTIQTMLESQRTMRELVKLRVRQIETEKDVKQLQDNQTSFRQQLPITSN